MGEPPLGLRQDLERIKEWMITQNLYTLWDISIMGNDEHKLWVRWGINKKPPDLEEDWNTLKFFLQGKSPLK